MIGTPVPTVTFPAKLLLRNLTLRTKLSVQAAVPTAASLLTDTKSISKPTFILAPAKTSTNNFASSLTDPFSSLMMLMQSLPPAAGNTARKHCSAITKTPQL
jgi:hypothetical protein